MDDIQTLFDSDEAENEYMQEIARKAASKRILDVTCSTRSIWFNKRYGTYETKEEQDEWLDTENSKIFGKGGYPHEWVDSLERRE